MTKRTVHIKYQKTEYSSLTSVFDDDIDLADESTEPYNTIQAKIAMLQDLLDCTEQDAERMVLGTY